MLRTPLVPVLVLLAAAVAPAVAGFKAHAKDFRCLLDGATVPGRNYYLFHRNKQKLAKAVRTATADVAGTHLPVGTIVQVFPNEAMVKRGGHFNRAGGGWEFFQLDVTASGATIAARGGAEVANRIGSCQGCHLTGSAPQHDLICEGHGALQLPFTIEQVRALQALDPRCQPAN